MYVAPNGNNPTEQMVWDEFDNEVTAFFGSVNIDLSESIELSIGRYDKEDRSVTVLFLRREFNLY